MNSRERQRDLLDCGDQVMPPMERVTQMVTTSFAAAAMAKPRPSPVVGAALAMTDSASNYPTSPPANTSTPPTSESEGFKFPGTP